MGCATSNATRYQPDTNIDGMPLEPPELGKASGSQRKRLAEALRAMPLFAHVKEAQLQTIVAKQLPGPWFVPGGTTILSEGVVPTLQGPGPLDGFFILLDGALQVFKTFEFGEQAVYEFKTAAFPGAPGVAARPGTTPFFGERVLCGLSGSRSATVKAIGPAELLLIPRAVWTSVYNRAMGRVVEEEQMTQMMREYALLLEGNHVELALMHGKEMRRFANDRDLPAPELAEPERHRKRRGSVTKVVTREELRQNRRTSASDDPAAPKERVRRKSVSTGFAEVNSRARRASVSENLINSKNKSTRYEGRSEGAKARRKSVTEADGSAAAAAAAAASFALPGQSLLEDAEEAEEAAAADGKAGEKKEKKKRRGHGEEKKEKEKRKSDDDPGRRRRRKSVA